jgi:hypothetical protein
MYIYIKNYLVLKKVKKIILRKIDNSKEKIWPAMTIEYKILNEKKNNTVF